MAAISHVFTISRVAQMLAEDEHLYSPTHRLKTNGVRPLVLLVSSC